MFRTVTHRENTTRMTVQTLERDEKHYVQTTELVLTYVFHFSLKLYAMHGKRNAVQNINWEHSLTINLSAINLDLLDKTASNWIKEFQIKTK